jgi:hypothetical protein
MSKMGGFEVARGQKIDRFQIKDWLPTPWQKKRKSVDAFRRGKYERFVSPAYLNRKGHFSEPAPKDDLIFKYVSSTPTGFLNSCKKGSQREPQCWVLLASVLVDLSLESRSLKKSKPNTVRNPYQTPRLPQEQGPVPISSLWLDYKISNLAGVKDTYIV